MYWLGTHPLGLMSFPKINVEQAVKQRTNPTANGHNDGYFRRIMFPVMKMRTRRSIFHMHIVWLFKKMVNQ